MRTSSLFLLAICFGLGCSGTTSSERPEACRATAECTGGDVCTAGVCGPGASFSGPLSFHSNVLYNEPRNLHGPPPLRGIVYPGSTTTSYLPSGAAVAISDFPGFTFAELKADHSLAVSHVIVIRQGQTAVHTVPGLVTGCRVTAKGVFAITWMPDDALGRVELRELSNPQVPIASVSVSSMSCVQSGFFDWTEPTAIASDVLNDEGSIALLAVAFREDPTFPLARSTCAAVARNDGSWTYSKVDLPTTSGYVQAFSDESSSTALVVDQDGYVVVVDEAGPHGFPNSISYVGTLSSTLTGRPAIAAVSNARWATVDPVTLEVVDYGPMKEGAVEPWEQWRRQLFASAAPVPSRRGVLVPTLVQGTGAACLNGLEYRFRGPADGGVNTVLSRDFCDSSSFYFVDRWGTWVSFSGYDLTYVGLIAEDNGDMRLHFVEDRVMP